MKKDIEIPKVEDVYVAVVKKTMMLGFQSSLSLPRKFNGYLMVFYEPLLPVNMR